MSIPVIYLSERHQIQPVCVHSAPSASVRSPALSSSMGTSKGPSKRRHKNNTRKETRKESELDRGKKVLVELFRASDSVYDALIPGLFSSLRGSKTHRGAPKGRNTPAVASISGQSKYFVVAQSCITLIAPARSLSDRFMEIAA